MADSQFTQQEVKGFIKDGLALQQATVEEAIDYYTNKYGAVKGAEGYKYRGQVTTTTSVKQVSTNIHSHAGAWDRTKVVVVT